MLESFILKEEDAVRVGHEDLRTTTTAIFEKMGVPSSDAAVAADVLVMADLRGVDSHGVSNMLRTYVQGYTNGTINPTPDWKIIRERPSTANIDSDLALGIIIAPKAMEIAIAKAKRTGIGVVTMGRAGHVGMAAYHAMMALPHNMIGICLSGTPPQVLPTFGAEPRLGTNPIAVAVPTKNEDPFVLDIATSVVAINKFRIAKRLGATIPGGMLADMEGTPIMEAGLVPGEFLGLPMGALRELGSHKGYGLACVVEVLSTVLGGFGFAARNTRSAPGGFAHYVAAYDIDAFTDVPEFKQTMDDFLQTLKATRPAPGHERVLVPGQLEAEATAERTTSGIPLHKEVVEWFRGTCAELSITCNF
jgi:L-2-hydroxycarboxylate dehydrogenase (NAD+)